MVNPRSATKSHRNAMLHYCKETLRSPSVLWHHNNSITRKCQKCIIKHVLQIVDNHKIIDILQFMKPMILLHVTVDFLLVVIILHSL